ncbi:MAG TPA: hypothetical protein VGH28_08145 [Polyangiaceae bacterium]|jgi:hypothetical protein
MKVDVSVTVRGKEVLAADVPDRTLSAALKKMGDDVGKALSAVKCPEHKTTATNVRVHVNAAGEGDLRYDSCCDKLAAAITKVMG